jgi:uncharacterized protein
VKLLAACACGVLVAVTVAAQTFPKPTGRVSDFANIIAPEVESELDAQLAGLENTTSHEVAVVTVPSLDGTTVDDYANRLFKEWGIGQAGKDNGVLILVAPNKREVRIEVGYGLEGILPDGLAGQVRDDEMLPRFREDDYSAGIRDGTLRIIDIVSKEQVLTPAEIAALNDGSADIPVWFIIPFFSLFVGIGFLMIGAGVRARSFFALLFGLLFGGMPMLMGLLLQFTVSLFTIVPLAIGMAWLGYRLGGRQSWKSAFEKASQGGGSSSSSSDSDSGSSSSSSGSSSSDFGGGSSGGGGASGRW